MIRVSALPDKGHGSKLATHTNDTGNMSAYPTQRPPMPACLKGSASVKSSTGDVRYTVNFDTGECDCQHGQAWRWDDRKWVPANLCAHKLRAIASMLERTPSDELRAYYDNAVGRRHNAFVAVSAMHKELRRADTEAALYWANVMVAHRGLHGIINYLRNIVFEETRDLALYSYILRLSAKGKTVSRVDMSRAVVRFATAPKKWELPWRLDIFLDEQRAYKKLAEKYTYAVAKPSDIIAETERGTLHKTMLAGFKEADRVKVQYGLKGLLKSKASDNDKMRVGIFNTLVDVLNGDFPNAFEVVDEYAHKLQDAILARITSHGAPGYHELNALCDALTGENGLQSIATLPAAQHKLIVNSPRVYALPLGDFRRIPLYANDNHTWPGQALLRSYGDTELKPGVRQSHIDFRYWGAYGGVAWRLLAWKQHRSINCGWHEVSWRQPPWLWQHVEQMNY